MKPYPNEELDRMSKREIIRLYKRTVEQFNDAVPVRHAKLLDAHPYGECSNCGYLIDAREEFNYCPACGARMDKK